MTRRDFIKTVLLLVSGLVAARLPFHQARAKAAVEGGGGGVPMSVPTAVHGRSPAMRRDNQTFIPIIRK
jgi:hypothetical protein